jgi:uncharacterized protein
MKISTFAKTAFAALVGAMLVCSPAAHAWEEAVWGPNDRDLRALDVMKEMFPEGPAGSLAWTTIGRAKEKIVERNGQSVPMPSFDPEMIALNGKEVTVVGFMLPIEATMDQKKFMLSPLPVDCPYCMPAGPNLLIQVEMKNTIRYNYDLVQISGKLELQDESGDEGLFYKILGATELKQ